MKTETKSDQLIKLEEFLAQKMIDISFSPVYVNRETKQFDYKVEFYRRGTKDGKRYVFDFHTGWGWVKPGFLQNNKNVPFNPAYPTDHRIIRPTVLDVLFCLVLDASGVEESFQDWCGNFGYDEDSIKALSLYNTCKEIETKLKAIFPSHVDFAKLQELVEGY